MTFDALAAGQNALQPTRFLLSAWCIVHSLEWLKNSELFEPKALLSWDTLSLQPGGIYRSTIFSRIMSQYTIKLVCLVRITAAICLILIPSPEIDCIVLFIILFTTWAISTRTVVGGDGSDQMGYIVCIGALIVSAGEITGSAGVSFAGLLALGGQLTISYFIAGFAKLLSPTWRKGIALRGVMSTFSYGHSFAEKVAAGNQGIAFIICWAVILGETLFPLTLLSPEMVLILTLSAFMFFHLSNAYFMGLNAFVWSFAAAYPSTIELSRFVREVVFGS